jgi:hypothetical protein
MEEVSRLGLYGKAKRAVSLPCPQATTPPKMKSRRSVDLTVI